MSTLRLLENRSRASIVALGVVLALLLGVLDYATGWELSFSVFYLLPVSMVAWYAGRWPGVAVAAGSAAVWAIANRLAGQTHDSTFLTGWNALVRLGFFLVVSLTLTELRRTLAALHAALDREQALARIDSLTGISNARAFYEMAEREVSRAARYAHPLTLAYIDADGFKVVNDRLGHSAGDRVLKAIAQALTAAVRITDVVARLGGDEFAVLFPETGPEAARTALEKLQRALGEAMAAEGVPVTFCIGAVGASRPARTVDELIRQADALMYEVKHAGKNAIRLEVLADA